MALSPVVIEYINARMDSALGVPLKDYIDTRLADIEHARVQAHGALESRLGGMNEFRDTLSDQAKTFISRAEHDTLCTRVGELENKAARAEGRSSTATYIALLSAIVAVLSLLEKVLVK